MSSAASKAAELSGRRRAAAAQRSLPEPEREPASEEEKPDLREVLFPRCYPVTISVGEVVVRQLSIKGVHELSRRLPNAFGALLRGEQKADFLKLIPNAITEICFLASLAVRCDMSDLDEWDVEDVVDVVSELWDKCLEPLQGKGRRLAVRMGYAQAAPQAKAPEPIPDKTGQSFPTTAVNH